MSQNRPFKTLRKQLIDHGLQVSEIRRYVDELRAHRQDIVAELIASGLPPVDAQLGADHRLGDVHTLVAAKIKQVRSSTFAGRHPCLCFSFMPAFSAAASFTVLTMLLATSWHFKIAPRWLGAVSIAAQLILPGVLAILFYQAARRRALARAWRIVPLAVILLSVVWFRISMRLPPEFPGTQATFWFGIVPSPNFIAMTSALILPVVWISWLENKHVRAA